MKRFGELGEEERQTMLAKARTARAAKQAARNASRLRHDFLDADHWVSLARERRLRLPPWGERATVVNMRAWCHKLGWNQRRLEAWAGCTLLALLERNPLWPARASIMLEQEAEQITGQRNIEDPPETEGNPSHRLV